MGRPDVACGGPDTIVEELISPAFADALRRLGAVLIVTDEIPRTQWTERISGGRSMSWGLSLNKMQIFNMTQYRKIVFMDADTIVFKNLDHLFGPEYPMFTGELRCGTYWPKRRYFAYEVGAGTRYTRLCNALPALLSQLPSHMLAATRWQLPFRPADFGSWSLTSSGAC